MDPNTKANVKQAVPFFFVMEMERSLQFYVTGLGFEMTHQWTPRGSIEWCCLRRGGASVMLQEYRKESIPAQNLNGQQGRGVTICFLCEGALELYHEFSAKGLMVSEPFVGNGLWNIGLTDPDGYRLEFESETNVPEETRFSDWKAGGSK